MGNRIFRGYADSPVLIHPPIGNAMTARKRRNHWCYAINVLALATGTSTLLTLAVRAYPLKPSAVHALLRSGQHIDCEMATPLLGTDELTIHHTLHLRNKTGKAFRITNAVTSCGCTTAHVPDNVIPEGSSFEVGLNVAFGHGGGDRMVKCAFLTDAGTTWSVGFRAAALPIIQLDYAAQSIWAGEFLLGDGEPWSGTAVFIHNSPMHISNDLKVGLSGEELSGVKVTEIPVSKCPIAIRAPAGDLFSRRAYRLSFTIKPQSFPGSGRSWVELNLDRGTLQGKQGTGTLHIPVTWSVSHPHLISPKQLVVRPGAPDSELPAFEIRSKLKRPFDIADITFSDGAFCVDELRPSEDRVMWKFTIRTTGVKSGIGSGELSRGTIIVKGHENNPLMFVIVRM